MVPSTRAKKRPLESPIEPKTTPKKSKELQKAVKVKIDGKKTIIGNLMFEEEHVEKSVAALLQLQKNIDKDKNTLLSHGDNPIFLQITCIKVPKTPRRNLRL